jgi:riboflavin-specific deaminase-like protein
VHVATSLDGRIALDGRTTALSTPEGRRSAHSARAAADAVLVGSGTVRIDDPRLTVREVEGRNPLRIVLASSLALPSNARVFDKCGSVLVIGVEGHEGSLENAEVVLVRSGPDGMVGLREALEVLRKRGVERLLVEGGARVLTSFFKAGLVDRVEIEFAMTVLGGGTPLVETLPVPVRLTDVTTERLGTSVLVRGTVSK